MIRWLKFNAVGVAGAAVQLAVLTVLVKIGLHYLAATAIAVEVAILHNYFWHVRWTWVDKADAAATRGGTFWRFQLANGMVSLGSNLVLMRLFTGAFGMPPWVANGLAIVLTSVVNFLLGNRWVFADER